MEGSVTQTAGAEQGDGLKEIAHQGDSERQDERERMLDQAQTPTGAQQLTAEEQLDALEWLLQDDPDDDAPVTQTFEMNVGTDEVPRILTWTIRPLDGDTFNELRAQARAQGNRAQRRSTRRSGEIDFDVTVFNLRVVAAATVEPNLKQAAEAKGVGAADPLLGPVAVLQHRFQRKPGLLDQLAGKVMLLSGYDEDDVVRATPELRMVKAAGNS